MKSLWLTVAGVTVCSAVIGSVAVGLLKPSASQTASISIVVNGFDPLSHEPLSVRISQLANNPAPRQRLLLAELSLQKNDPRSALSALDGLEKEYELLADYVLLKRAQALTQMGNQSQANQVWQELLSRYGDRPTSAEALWALNRKEELIRKFPSHTRSRQALLQMIGSQPQRLELIRQLVTYFPDSPQIVPLLNRLTSGGMSLTPEQWWSIANAYYDNFEFTRAANAYSRAVPHSFTLYRQGRSWHRAKQIGNALSAYRRVVDTYPQSPEAPRALIRIMQLGSSAEVQSASDRLVQSYPDTAAEGLLLRAERGVNRDQAIQLLLSQYGKSEASAQWRWQVARDQAKRGRLKEALSTVQTIMANNPQSSVLAESAFWGGKWAQKLGDATTAQRLFHTALKLQPNSYFAWRSAVALGWTEVGDFSTARNVNLALRPVSLRSSLPAGSPVVNELYVIGLDRSAYDHWQN
jgi:soluble lytic murein transglycosylase